MNTDFTFTNLVEAAKKEQWDIMDAQIPNFCNNEKIIYWSLQEGFEDENANVRDLAVSLLEKSKYELQDDDKTKLHTALENDENVYVQFRAAFTLYNRGDRSEDVMNKMNEALDNTEVKEIAEKYLSQ